MEKRGESFPAPFFCSFLFSSLLHCANCSSSATWFLYAHEWSNPTLLSPTYSATLLLLSPPSFFPCSQNTYSLFPSSLPFPFSFFFWRVALGIPDSPESFFWLDKKGGGKGGKYVHNRVEEGVGLYIYIHSQKRAKLCIPRMIPFVVAAEVKEGLNTYLLYTTLPPQLPSLPP